MENQIPQDELGLYDVFAPVYIPYWKQWWFIVSIVVFCCITVFVVAYFVWKLYTKTTRYAIKVLQKKIKSLSYNVQLSADQQYDALLSYFQQYVQLKMRKVRNVYGKGNVEKIAKQLQLSEDQKQMLYDILHEAKQVRFSQHKHTDHLQQHIVFIQKIVQ